MPEMGNSWDRWAASDGEGVVPSCGMLREYRGAGCGRNIPEEFLGAGRGQGHGVLSCNREGVTLEQGVLGPFRGANCGRTSNGTVGGLACVSISPGSTICRAGEGVFSSSGPMQFNALLTLKANDLGERGLGQSFRRCPSFPQR